MMKKRKMLLTNDDGYNSNGIQLLYHIFKKDYNIVIVAPNCEKSGVGHSFTFKYPVFYEKIYGSYANKIYSIYGTPADCIKFAISHLLKQSPNLIVSGLNIGDNSGISSFYSGTVAAAREGAFWKIRSFAFSLCEEYEKYSFFYVKMIPKIINDIINVFGKFSRKIFYNINFPSCHPDKVKGIKITRQSTAIFNDKYRKINTDYFGKIKNGYKIYGKKVNIELLNDYDSRALLNGWITITPLTFDSTAIKEFFKMKCLEKFLKGIINDRS